MPVCQSQSSLVCPDKFNCVSGVCPDFEIKRHDTRPSFVITVSDCDGALDLTDAIVEVSMWTSAKLKKKITKSDTYFALADNIGFEQSLVGDIIATNRVRAPEQMLITGHDEINKLIQVQRGYNGSTISEYPRGTGLRIFRVLNFVGETNMVKEDIEQLDGTILEDELIESQLIYKWQPNDTCLPGCYYLEFKLLKMATANIAGMNWLSITNAVVPTFTSVTPADECGIGAGVEWARRFPVETEGFIIKVVDSPTNENLV